MSRTTRTILLALLLACGPAQASEWVSLGKTIGGDETSQCSSSARGSRNENYARGLELPLAGIDFLAKSNRISSL